MGTRQVFVLLACAAATIEGGTMPGLRILPPITQENLTVFPVVLERTHDTRRFITLDEGLRSGEVVVTEEGGAGLVRPRRGEPLPWQERRGGAEVNRLVLVNRSDRPLVLLAGEIVTGGKQDRIVGRDRIVPAKSDPMDLGVFCVEPHRWVETSARFDAMSGFMAQPGVRKKAMAKRDQRQVWDSVAESRAAVMAQAAPPAAQELSRSSSYADTMGHQSVQRRMEALTAPMEREYDRILAGLRAEKAVGAVVAVNGEVVFADIFADAALLQRYWPKLIRSYAAEALSSQRNWYGPAAPPVREGEAFLADFTARHEDVESEPGVYRNTHLAGDTFDAFILTAMLPGTSFDVHVAKMKQ